MSKTQFATFSPEKQASILHDFMDLFRGNSRGYGVGEFIGAKQRETDNKWTPGHVRWTWGPPGDDQYLGHLRGDFLTGIGVLCDDGNVWFTCLDVDDYDIDYHDVMNKIQRLALPIVVFRTKSGGLRIALFFSEPVEAKDVLSRMKRLAGVLGYSGSEIFPKQVSLDVKNGDCPSWIFLPYGGTGDIFPEQGAMNDSGNLMDIPEAIRHCQRQRLTQKQFLELFAEEDRAKANGKANGNKHPKGTWMQEDTVEKTIDTMFWGGPPCLWTIVHTKYQHFQNNFLLNCAVFLKKKYPENWDKPLEWVNFNILQPTGNMQKLAEIIKSVKGHDYTFKCNDEPIVSFCFSDACRKQLFGVGDNSGVEGLELGMTVVNCIPRIYYVNAGNGDGRMMLEGKDIATYHKYKEKCLENGVKFPLNFTKSAEWDKLITKAMENATIVEPLSIQRTNVNEIELLSTWFSRVIPPWVKKGVVDDKTDYIRIKEVERRIYFKWERLADFLRRIYNERDAERMRIFVANQCEEHKEGRGHWWRHTWSISFDKFDEEAISRWLNPE